MTQELLSKFTPHIGALTLVPSSGGRFELTVDDALLFSKKASGRHAQPGEVARLLQEQFGFVETPID